MKKKLIIFFVSYVWIGCGISMGSSKELVMTTIMPSPVTAPYLTYSKSVTVASPSFTIEGEGVLTGIKFVNARSLSTSYFCNFLSADITVDGNTKTVVEAGPISSMYEIPNYPGTAYSPGYVPVFAYFKEGLTFKANYHRYYWSSAEVTFYYSIKQ